MMGKDCERIVVGINNVKDIINSQIISLSSSIATQRMTMEYKGGDIHGSAEDVSFDKLYDVQEIEDTMTSSSYLSAIESAMGSINTDVSKMKKLERSMYTSSNQFNNSYGSPWKELKMLENSIKEIRNYCSNNPVLKFLGQKVGLVTLMNAALSYAVDSKWAMIYYHDYIQRGYDHVYNGDRASIEFRKAREKTTIGNINQDYSENVNIHKKSIAPF